MDEKIVVVGLHMSPADVAYELMKAQTRAMAARDLVDNVIELMDLDREDPAVKAQVYTTINLDPRLVFLGKGIWGIRDWSPTAVAAATSMPDFLPREENYQPKPDDYLWDDEIDGDELDSEEEDTTASPDEEEEEPLEDE